MFKTCKLLLIFLVFLFIQSCAATKVVDVKSPCVSGEDGPCGPRRPVNTWLNNYLS